MRRRFFIEAGQIATQAYFCKLELGIFSIFFQLFDTGFSSLHDTAEFEMPSIFSIQRIFFSLLLVLVFTSASQDVFAQQKMTLEESYQLALVRSETVAISYEEIAKAKARFKRILGAVLPKVNVFAQEFLQDASGSASDGSVGATFTRFSRPEVSVNVHQELFQGLKEITAFKLSKVDRRQQIDRWEDAKRLLYQDVANTFYTIAQLEMNLQTNYKILNVLNSRLGGIQDRVRLGKSRVSDQLSQEADISFLEANIERDKGAKAVAYEMLAFLTGLDPQPPIQYGSPVGDGSVPLENYLGTMGNRPDILAAEKGVELAHGEVKIRKSDLLPRANADFNYYPYRVGFLQDIHWDATFNLAIPVFNYETYGFISEAKATAKQSEYRAEEVRRVAMTEVKQAYDAFQSAIRQVVKYQAAAKKSEASYRAQVEDFSLGIITNVDVLQSQRTWFAALNQLNDAIAQAWRDQVTLQVASGKVPNHDTIRHLD